MKIPDFNINIKMQYYPSNETSQKTSNELIAYASSLPLAPAREHSHIYLYLCICDVKLINLIAANVISKFLVDAIHPPLEISISLNVKYFLLVDIINFSLANCRFEFASTITLVSQTSVQINQVRQLRPSDRSFPQFI